MKLFHPLLLLGLLFSTTLSLTSADLGKIKSDMKERLPAIEALWAKGAIGENNQGFIEARTELTTDQQKLMQAENADRKIVYQAIARSTQTTPQKVGIQRAAQISKRAAKGLWLQGAKDEWYKK